MEPVRPDFAGAWVGALVPSLLGGAPASWMPHAVHGARAVVLLVLDGLGWAAVEQHPGRLRTLAAMEGGPITTVAPSTTAAALPSITTGLTPGEHGLVGYRIRLAGDTLNVLQWRLADGGYQPDPADVQPHPPFLGQAVPVLSRAEFERTGFTKAHLRGSFFVGWRTESTMVEYCRRLVGEGAPFVYAYADGVDRVAHAHGLVESFYLAELRAADRLVSDLLDVLPEEAALLVTSDHGQVQVGSTGMVRLEPLARYVAGYSGEGRFRALHARHGLVAELRAAARDEFGDRAWILTREELLDGGWFGPRPAARVTERVGDVVLAAREAVAFIDPAQPQELQLASCHGSVTDAEMRVPLLAARGRAGR